MTNQQTTLNETITDSTVEKPALKAKVFATSEKEKEQDITKNYGLVTQ